MSLIKECMKRYILNKRRERIGRLKQTATRKELEEQLSLKRREVSQLRKFRIVHCIYKHRQDDDTCYKFGYALSLFEDAGVIFILWDEFGRFITDKDVTKTYQILSAVPNAEGFSNNLGLKNVYLRSYLNDNFNTVTDGKVCYMQSVSTLRQDCDLRLVTFMTDTMHVGCGLYCKDNTLNGAIYNLNGEKVENKMQYVKDLEMSAISNALNAYRGLEWSGEENTLFLDKIIPYLDNVKIEKCNLAHLILLLDCKIVVNIYTTEDSKPKLLVPAVTLRLGVMQYKYMNINVDMGNEHNLSSEDIDAVLETGRVFKNN